MSQHTPGPWHVVDGDCLSERQAVENATGYRICNVPNWSHSPRNAANARLIAAAPDLLAVGMRMYLAYEREDADALDAAHADWRSVVTQVTGAEE